MSFLDQLTAPISARSFLRWRRHHALPPGSSCRNCGSTLAGPWCHACGQLGEDFHRSAHHLIGEAFEGFFHADGRLFHTLPRLLFRPGQLTRDYLRGKRAPQIPPFRLFLVMLLLVFLAGGTIAKRLPPQQVGGTAAEREEIKRALSTGQIRMDIPGGETVATWLRSRVPRAVDNPSALVSAMGEWAHRFAFLTLPVSALILAALFAFRRETYLFDHLIFSMHSLSFQGFLVAAVIAFPNAVSPAWLLLVSPVHLFIHMRGTYGTGVFGTLARMALLFAMSTVAYSLLLLGLVLVGLYALGDTKP